MGEQCRRDIARLQRGELAAPSLSPKYDFGGRRVLWQYWGQGWQEEKLPEVVRLCAQSVDRYRGECLVVRLSDADIAQYIDLPDHIVRLRLYNRAFFADVLRLALLATYGGVWLDATVLLTRQIPSEYLQADFFAYQRSQDEAHKSFWRASYYAYYGWADGFKVRLLNSVIFAKAGSPLVVAMYTLLDNYWQEHERELDYFFFQIYFHELVTGEYAQYNSPLVNDCNVHIVQNLTTGGSYPWMTMREALEQYPIHKLTYKGVSPEQFSELKQILNYTS